MLVMPGMRFLSVAAALAAVTVSWCPPAASADPQAYACGDPAKVTHLVRPLARMSAKLAAGQPVAIMALGSSSTAGAGASTPAASYPSRLEVELRAALPGHAIMVINRGVNGEEAADMLARFDAAVAADKPDVVIWQVGTNALLRDDPLGQVDRLVYDGLARMKALNADVILIDPQFAPTVLAKPDADDMVSLIAAATKKQNVDLFPRFAVMRGWHEQNRIPFTVFMSPDQLHMNDWGYACLARLLGSAMVEAATRPLAAAQVGAPRSSVRAPAH